MDDILSELIDEYSKLKNRKPKNKDVLISYLKMHLNAPSHLTISKQKIYELIKEKENLKQIFLSLKNETEIKMFYFLYKLSNLRKKEHSKLLNYSDEEVENTSSVYKELEQNIKKGALGFKISYFEDFKISLLRDNIELHLYEIIFHTYQNATIYKKLKNKKECFKSKAHLYFYEVVRKELRNYELQVINTDMKYGVLGFHVSMYNSYINLNIIHQLSEMFEDNPRNPFEFLKFYQNKFLKCESKNSENEIFDEIVECCCREINSLLNSWLFKGDFSDPSQEFFIKKSDSGDLWTKYGIEYGLVPYFIDSEDVEKILYIGKCVNLLKVIIQKNNRLSTYAYTSKIVESVNILDSNFSDKINLLLKEVNEEIKITFLEGEEVLNHLEFSRKIFLFGRGDFIETLFFYLKEYGSQKNRFSKGSICSILDSALINTFNSLNKFTERVDVCILDNENQWDYISLFCNLDFPINLILTKEVLMKLVCVFKYLWKVKRIEDLLKSLKRAKPSFKINGYIHLINKIQFYVYEEAISVLWINDFYEHKDKLIIDEIRRGVNRSLDSILLKIFQVTNKGKEEMDVFLYSLEQMCICLGKSNSNIANDDVVKSNFKVFHEKFSNELIGTSLFDIKRFVV